MSQELFPKFRALCLWGAIQLTPRRNKSANLPLYSQMSLNKSLFNHLCQIYEDHQNAHSPGFSLQTLQLCYPQQCKCEMNEVLVDVLWFGLESTPSFLRMSSKLLLCFKVAKSKWLLTKIIIYHITTASCFTQLNKLNKLYMSV